MGNLIQQMLITPTLYFPFRGVSMKDVQATQEKSSASLKENIKHLKHKNADPNPQHCFFLFQLTAMGNLIQQMSITPTLYFPITLCIKILPVKYVSV
jgi:hypothetical protein